MTTYFILRVKRRYSGNDLRTCFFPNYGLYGVLSPLLIFGWYWKLDIQPVVIEAHSLDDFDKGGV
jgi:hypothetical protein